MQRRHPFADRQTVDLLDRNILSPLDLQQKRVKLFEIARVIPDRMIGEITLVFEMVEKLFCVGTQAASLRVQIIHVAWHNRIAILPRFRRFQLLPDSREYKLPY